MIINVFHLTAINDTCINLIVILLSTVVTMLDVFVHDCVIILLHIYLPIVHRRMLSPSFGAEHEQKLC